MILAGAALLPASWTSTPATTEEAAIAAIADDCTPFAPQFTEEEVFADKLVALCHLVLGAAVAEEEPSAAVIAADSALSRYLDIIDALSVRPVATEASGIRVNAWRDVPPASKYLVADRLGLLDLAARLLPADAPR